MGEFIVCIVVDILRHIPVEIYQRGCVSRVRGPARRLLAILNSSELIVLDPKISLQDFKRSKESQYILISLSPSGIERAEASGIGADKPAASAAPAIALFLKKLRRCARCSLAMQASFEMFSDQSPGRVIAPI